LSGKENTAQCYGSSSGFKLPNGNVRSPDIAVVLSSNPFFGKRMESFIPAAPDFIIEIRSNTDSPSLVKEKMHEWIQNGTKLAFLIDPVERR
jgi:Uma2 family endonuclease